MPELTLDEFFAAIQPLSKRDPRFFNLKPWQTRLKLRWSVELMARTGNGYHRVPLGSLSNDGDGVKFVPRPGFQLERRTAMSVSEALELALRSVALAEVEMRRRRWLKRPVEGSVLDAVLA